MARLVPGAPTSEQSFVAGFVEPAHLNPEKFRGELPPNGSFEGQFRPTSSPPDRWEVANGTWITDLNAGVVKGVSPPHGARILTFANTNVKAQLLSDYFPVEQLHVFRISGWVYWVSGDNNMVLEVQWFTGAKGSLSSSTLTIDLGLLTAGQWYHRDLIVQAPSTAALARFLVGKDVNHTSIFYVDDVRLTDFGEPWHYIDATGEPAFENSWDNFAAGTDPEAGFRLDGAHGQLKGKVAGGSSGTVAFTLPEALWPPEPVNVPVVANGGFGYVTIDETNGEVTITAADVTWVDLTAVRWPLFA